MAEVIFNYEGRDTIIQCNFNDKMSDIINKYFIKIGKNKNDNNLYYIYDGNIIKNNELAFNQLANKLDKECNKMKIIVNSYDDNDNNEEIKQMLSKDIICPQCGDNTLINITDFKINFYGCKNDHKINDILLDKYENTQKIDLSKITCDQCKVINKGTTHNNDFYICITCIQNICPLCKSKHDKNHIIRKYDDKNYICKKHNESFNKYCKVCKENICIICENDHNNHNIIDFGKMIPKKDELIKGMEDLQLEIDKFKNKIEIIKEIFNRIINMMKKYYEINSNIINNYDISKRNYTQLLNLNNIKNNNENLIKELNNVINDDFDEIFKFSIDKYYNENGEKYIGEMKDGMKNGKGILFYNKNDAYKRIRYEGYFKNDKFEGKGIMYYKDNERYVGDFKNDKFEGKGIMYYKDGDRYEGDFKNNKYEGKGIYYWNNSDRYEGDYKNGQRDGKGIMYYKDGKKEEGNWTNDKKEGKGFLKLKI